MIYVAIGGFFGAIARFSISEWMKKQLQSPSFVATFSINCIGSFFLGLCFGSGLHGEFYNFLGIGFLGAFTTFSTFSYEVVQLIENQKYRIAFLYMIGSLIIGIVMAAVGLGIHYL
jgi:fluoride exporter